MMTLLKKCVLFSDFTGDQLEALAAIAAKKQVQAGLYVFREGDPGESLIIIETGTLSLTKKDRQEAEIELNIVGSGSVIGEMAMLNEGVRSTSGKALERTSLYLIPYSALLNLLERNDAMAAKFYRRMATSIAKRLNYMNHDVVALKKFLKSAE